MKIAFQGIWPLCFTADGDVSVDGVGTGSDLVNLARLVMQHTVCCPAAKLH